MTIRLHEVVRSEVEGGLSGPANPIPSQSIDCGCAQMQCPRLAKFATRDLFVGLICWIGIVQAASHTYFYVAGPTIARRFQFDPYVMDWILVTAELTPFIFGLLVAYWGDKIHRASWIGALTLLQSVSYFVLIIPHLTHRVRVIEETGNVTHMSLYADDSPDLCTPGISRVIVEEDTPCYFTMFILTVVLIVTGIANITYYALGISYLDDNTKGRHVIFLIGIIIAVKIVGVLLGYLVGWGCLRIDAENLNAIESYQDQIGAWWLGFPILAILLVVPGLLLSWFPRRLPSEVVEQAAASLLYRNTVHNRAPYRTINQKAGSPDFWPSFCRLITNRILICNIIATVFCAVALINFMTHENAFLESRFHVPKPTGTFLGFGDPLLSRTATAIATPLLIGMIVIISGLVIGIAKPRARVIVSYNFVIILLILAIFILLIFDTCDKPPIVGMDKKSISLLNYCNRNCRCSKDADFRPICDNLGIYTFYSSCYAGCTSITYVDNVKIYSDCQCVEDMTGQSNDQAKDGSCDSMKCQAGWMLFEMGTSLAYALVASTFIGDLLINIRSVYKQDKAISIGFWMTWIAIFVNVPGKLLYEFVSDQTCRYWGGQETTCRLHDGDKLGHYLCYLTILFLSLCLLFKIIVWFFCKDLRLYEETDAKSQEGAELRELIEEAKASEPREAPNNNDNATARLEEIIEPQSNIVPEAAKPVEENPPKQNERDQTSAPLKYGPLGSGDLRTNPQEDHNSRSTIKNLDSEDELDSSSDESKTQSSSRVAYKPLELDSDVESDLGSAEPRSRKRISGKDYDLSYKNENDSQPSAKDTNAKLSFPNPDHYEDPRRARSAGNPDGYMDGSSKTNSFEFSKRKSESDVSKRGDFNEIGIPVADSFSNGKGDLHGSKTSYLKDVRSLIDRYEQKESQESVDGDVSSVKSTESRKNQLDGKIVSGIPLVAMVPGGSSSRGQSSPGLESLPDAREKNPDSRTERRGTPSPKGGKPAFRTDL